jgi:hypothetical protein
MPPRARDLVTLSLVPDFGSTGLAEALVDCGSLPYLGSPEHSGALAVQLPVADILAELLHLEVDGLIRETSGGFVGV